MITKIFQGKRKVPTFLILNEKVIQLENILSFLIGVKRNSVKYREGKSSRYYR